MNQRLRTAYVIERTPPDSRHSKAAGGVEQHLTEGAVMVAMAEWLFSLGATHATMHPDGMHFRNFDLHGLLGARGFSRVEARGKTDVGGLWQRDRHSLLVYSKPGRGDVVAEIDGSCIEVETKGGIVNTMHAGQRSRLRRHLYEAVGQLLDTRGDADRFIAAVPRHRDTEALARRMAARCRQARIEIALVAADGSVKVITPSSRTSTQ